MTADDDQQAAWRQIDERLKGRPADLSAPHGPGFVAAPRSAGPVRMIALSMLVLAAALVAALAMAFRAIESGQMEIVQAVQVSLVALPLLALVPVLIALQRVWLAWRSRPRGGGS